MRRAASGRAGRPGFTLIEVLVVLTILALLAAFTVAGIGRVRSAQAARTTEASVTKYQKALNQQLSAVFDDATGDKSTDRGKTDRANILAFCDNDPDRAKAMLCYVYTKLEFPTTFAEAKSGVTVGGVLFRPRAIYASVPLATSLSLDDQAAVLLYLNLQEAGRRGASIALDDISGNATTTTPPDTANGNKTYTVLKDAWGNPITYRRWFQGDPELQQAPYVNSKLVGVMTDPYDRIGIDGLAKLRDWTNAPNKAAALGVVGGTTGLNANINPAFPVAFDGLNKVITVVSYGEDKAPGTDDIFGYRLARFGNRGD